MMEFLSNLLRSLSLIYFIIILITDLCSIVEQKPQREQGGGVSVCDRAEDTMGTSD